MTRINRQYLYRTTSVHIPPGLSTDEVTEVITASIKSLIDGLISGRVFADNYGPEIQIVSCGTDHSTIFLFASGMMEPLES